jgi:hypothetical protein
MFHPLATYGWCQMAVVHGLVFAARSVCSHLPKQSASSAAVPSSYTLSPVTRAPAYDHAREGNSHARSAKDVSCCHAKRLAGIAAAGM